MGCSKICLKGTVERFTINAMVSMVEYILNSITNRIEDLPPSWTLAFRPETARTRISGRYGGEQIWGNGGVRDVEVIKSDAQSLCLVAETASGLNNCLSRRTDGASHDCIH